MALDIDVSHRLGDFKLTARFIAEDGLIALIGPSGSGKTSLVNIIAGLIEPQEGRVAIDDTVLVDRGRGIFVKPRHRRIGYVFQDGRLFPHLTVRQNLLYGQLFVPKRERFATLGEVVELLGLGALLARRPALLSGGEKQRVAIGRALLTSPRLLLMDEPLASLDEQRRHEILPYIERLRDEVRVPIVYVSHVREEVERLASTIVRLEAGRIASITSAAGPRLISGDAAGELRQAE
jgi:molybdate transport system ATP-binding protein